MKINYLAHHNIDFTKWDACMDNAANSLPYAYSWYLDIVAKKKWDGLVLGDYEAVMPLVWNSKLFSWRQLYQPLVSQQHGVFGDELNLETVEAFLKSIPKHFKKVHLTLNEYTPTEILSNQGIRKVRNLVLPLGYSYEKIQKKYSKSLKKRLRKAQDLLVLKEEGEVGELVSFYRENLKQKISLSAQEWNLIERLFEALCSRGIGKIYQVQNPMGELLSYGIFIIHKKRVFNIFAASSEKGKEQFSMHFLLDQIIQQYTGKMLLLDFEGSEIPGIAAFFESFGAEEQWYYRYDIDRLPGWAKAALRLKDYFR